VLARFVDALGADGVCDSNALGQYVAAQNPQASDAWTDAMMLAMAAVPVDEEYVGDYPFNVRLYMSLGARDWNAIRAGKPFPAAALNSSAQGCVMDLLLHARSRISRMRGEDGEAPAPVKVLDVPEGAVGDDPAWWPSLDMRSLVVSPTLKEEDVLVCWAGSMTDVMTVDNAVTNYGHRRDQLGKEPLYRPAHRRKLKLTIATPDGAHCVVTGFSAVEVDPSYKPSTWKDLPPAIAKQFQDRIGL
jgi:hypothetical protein